jgi:hypothetical protein
LLTGFRGPDRHPQQAAAALSLSEMPKHLTVATLPADPGTAHAQPAPQCHDDHPRTYDPANTSKLKSKGGTSRDSRIEQTIEQQIRKPVERPFLHFPKAFRAFLNGMHV